MAFKKDSNITYKVKENGINEIITEKNNTVLMLREVAWGDRDYHLELRKWFVDGKNETAGKGVSFTSEETPHVLTETLAKLGYGNTEKIITNIKNRSDFETSLANSIGMKKVVKAKNTEVEVSNDDYYDPKKLIE